MLKYLLLCFVLVSFFVSSGLCANEYRDIVTVKLKKDQFKKILVKYEKNEKLFKFRWTLYTNNGLVIFKSYDRIVGQNILYARHKSQSFRVELMTRGGHHYNVPYLLVKFIEFNYETQEAEFQLFLSDRDSKVSLEYLKEQI